MPGSPGSLGVTSTSTGILNVNIGCHLSCHKSCNLFRLLTYQFWTNTTSFHLATYSSTSSSSVRFLCMYTSLKFNTILDIVTSLLIQCSNVQLEVEQRWALLPHAVRIIVQGDPPENGKIFKNLTRSWIHASWNQDNQITPSPAPDTGKS